MRQPHDPAKQERSVLDYLRKYGRITPADAFNALGVYRLAVYIRRLRQKEWDIATVRERRHDGRLKATCTYILSPDQRNEQ